MGANNNNFGGKGGKDKDRLVNKNQGQGGQGGLDRNKQNPTGGQGGFDKNKQGGQQQQKQPNWKDQSDREGGQGETGRK